MNNRDRASDCGCCEGTSDRIPGLLFNRPGLREIAYRSGDYGSFRQSLLAGLSRMHQTDMGGLRTRADDDFTIALIDAWAVAGDVLTFYIERTAQEHYLPTATERRSVDDMVQLIGYRLLPGVAAETWLAFTLETPPEPAGGVRYTPVPGVPDRVPIRKGIRVQSIPKPDERPQTFETVEAIDALAAWNTLVPRQTELRYPKAPDTSAWLAGVGIDLSPGDLLLFVKHDWAPGGTGGWALRRVASVDPDAVAQRTLVTWHGSLSGLSEADQASVYAIRQRASLFGYNAPNPRLFTNEVFGNLGTDVDATSKEWNFDEIAVGTGNRVTLNLSTVVPGLEPGSWLMLRNGADKQSVGKIMEVSEQSRSKYGVSAQVNVLGVDVETVPIEAGSIQSFYDGANVRSTVVLLGSELLPLAEAPRTDAVKGDRIALEHDLDPIDEPRSIIVRGRESPVPALTTQQAVAEDQEVIAEHAVVVAVEPGESGATLVLESSLDTEFARDTVEILGNVARATHGETVVREVLGSGDGSRPYQQFALRKSPLTWVRGETAGAIESTLDVWVNEVRWTEVPSLFGHGPRDRIYVTRIADDGTTVVQFGDGESGARPPTGQDNIVATYRSGTGMDGMLDAGQLSLLMDRPLGARGVTNPIAPAGAAPRQEAEDARVNAPRSVLTLGRIVSLQDYEDYAQDFLGVSKAAAVWTWDGARRGVLITVAGIDGEVVSPGDLVHTDLLEAIAAVSTPHVPFVVREHRPVTFRIGGTLRVESDREPETVLLAVRESLGERFSFAQRAFGQMVTLSELYEAIHAVAGVVSADIDHLYRGESATLNPWLVAEAPANGDPPGVEGAELLTLDPQSLEDLEIMS